MWIPELLLRMQGRECRAAAAPEHPMFNATHVAWKELTKLYDSYAKPEPISGFNATSEEKCSDNMDSEVRFCFSIFIINWYHCNLGVFQLAAQDLANIGSN